MYIWKEVTDNFNLDFPAIMSDGRQFTDYRSNCTLNKMSEQMSYRIKII